MISSLTHELFNNASQFPNLWDLVTCIFMDCICSHYDIASLKHFKSNFTDLITTIHWTDSKISFLGTPLTDHLLPFPLILLHPFQQFCDHISTCNTITLPLSKLFVTSWYHRLSSYWLCLPKPRIVTFSVLILNSLVLLCFFFFMKLNVAGEKIPVILTLLTWNSGSQISNVYSGLLKNQTLFPSSAHSSL